MEDTIMPDKTYLPPPLTHRELARRSAIRADGKPKRATASLLDISLDGVRDPRLVRKDGRLRVVASVDGNGIRPERRYQRIPVTRLKAKNLDPQLLAQEIRGHRPLGIATTFAPKLSKPTHQLRVGRGKGLDRGGSIFGNDDRYLFDDHSFPWRTTGKVRTVGKWGSGTTIGPRHVLTASHVVNWTGGSGGGVAWLTFTPGYFDGSGPWGEIAATRVIYWEQAPGSLTDQQTAFDYVVLVMDQPIGDVVGYPGYRTYDDAWNGGSYWQYIGFPGELSSGERPAFQGKGVISTVQNEGLSGQTGYVLGHFNEFTPGQSGGSVWGWWDNEPWPRVVGVGSTIGDTTVKSTSVGTSGDNEYGGGPALSALISWARSNYP
jgi:V8-like Glu-specific endopeptidase